MKLKGQLLTAHASLVLADGATGQTTLTSASTATRTVTLPDATDTLAGLTATQTLTNKTIGNTNTVTLKDNLFTLQDGGDATKQAQFQLSGLSAGATRTLVVPDANDTLVLLDLSQTLTNKTLTSPLITSATLTSPVITDLELNDTDSAFTLGLDSTSTLTANRTLTLDVENGNRTVTLAGNLTLAAAFATSGANSLTLTTTGATDVTLPTTGTLATRAGTETFTNKTLTSPVIDDYLDLNEETAPSAPASGKLRVYAKDDGKIYTLNSDEVETAVGSGAGEKTYITGASTASGWTAVGDLAVATSTTAAELPREHTTGTGIKITADADTQSTADYVYHDFTLDDVDLSKKLKISWSQKTTGTYAAGDLAVVITSQADRTTALHTPVTTAIPAVDGVFTTSFDASTTATLSLVIRATTDMATNGGIVISDVIVGPGVQPQGAVVGPETEYTLTIGASSVAPTPGSGATSKATWQRIGDTMRVRYNFAQSNAGSAGTGYYVFPMPSGYTIDTNRIPVSYHGTYGLGAVGPATGYDGTSNWTGVVVVRNTTGFELFLGHATASMDQAGQSAGIVKLDGSTARFSFEATVPIAEWAGSGTVNLAQNDVEYAYNTSGITAAGTSDTTSFGYGPAGATIGAINSTTTTTSFTTMRCRFLTPIQPTDLLILEINDGAGDWQPMSQRGYGFTRQGTAAYGAIIVPSSSTDVDVYFGNAGAISSNGTYGQAGSAWSGAGTWRVRKISGGAAVGFGHATETSSGLVSTTTQSLAGAKTWTGTQTINVTSGSNALVARGTPTSGTYAAVVINDNTSAGTNCGLRVDAGTNASDTAMLVRKADGSANYLNVYGDGVVSMPKQPFIHVYRNTSAQSVSDVTGTKIQFNAEANDAGSYFDSATNYRFTAPAAGVYAVTTSIQISGTAIVRAQVTLSLSGTYTFYLQDIQGISTSGPLSLGGSAYLSLAASDYVEVFLYADATGSVSVNTGVGASFLQIIKVA